uniref:Uncharacterized protein n=1 Tax=Schlesneria paludicola TaxID=360056 RepID=A0A7C2JZ33_9PLAN
MPVRRADLTTRSGRFKNLAANQTLVQSPKASKYRFFNTGKKPFTIQVKEGATVAKTTDLYPQCSVDVLLLDNTTAVAVGGTYGAITTAVAEIEGVYDLISDAAPIRSGRFKRKGNTPVTAIPIINGDADSLYRLYNVGESDLLIDARPEVLSPECSRDFALPSSSAFVSITGSENTFQGLYDLVKTGTGIRSGQFRFTEANPATEHLLIDVTGVTVGHRYRITNAGEFQFTVLGNGTALVTLKRDQSFDFQVVDSALRVITIRGVNDKLVNGIYDYLGPA